MQVIVTTALILKRFDERKKEYEEALGALAGFGTKPLLVECFLRKGPCFLEKYGPVFYPGVNDSLLRNKGVNEGKAMASALLHYGTGEGQTAKITGRYLLKSPKFLEQASRVEFDCTLRYDRYGQVFTGCFAMEGRSMLQMYSSLDYARMEKEMINVEAEVARYVRENGLSVNEMGNINLRANIFGLGDKYPLSMTEW